MSHRVSYNYAGYLFPTELNSNSNCAVLSTPSVTIAALSTWWTLYSGWTRGVQVKLSHPWERVPYLSALEVRSRRGAIQIRLPLPLPLQPANTARLRSGLRSSSMEYGLLSTTASGYTSSSASEHSHSLVRPRGTLCPTTDVLRLIQ